MADQTKLIRIALGIALAGFVFQTGLQGAMGVHAREAIYFQGWSSEALTQTVPIQDLRDAPLESLLNIHIEPPAFDAIRALFVAFSPGKDIHRALWDVDRRILVLWALLYGLSAALVFLWTAQLTRIATGIMTAVVFLLHPGTIFYTTLLDPTILTTFLLLCMYYLLWRIKGGAPWATTALTVVVVILFFTKSFFQAPLILLMGVCLHLLRVRRKQILIFLLTAGGVALLYSAKQYVQFGIFHTSSFAAYNLCKSVGIDNNYTVHLDLDGRDVTGLPSVVARQAKLTGAINYNNINYLDFTNYLSKKYLKYMLTFPIPEVAQQYAYNLELYWRPSSHYGNEVNVIVERLPYRDALDAVFSHPIFTTALLIGGAFVTWKTVRDKETAAAGAMLLPALAIFVITVIGDKGENMRYKFFLEPVYTIFVVWTFAKIIAWVRTWARERL